MDIVSSKGNPFRDLWIEYLYASTRYKRNPNSEDLRKEKDNALFKLRLVCKMKILQNAEKFSYIKPPEKPIIRITKNDDLPDEYYQWDMEFTRTKRKNHTNMMILRETIDWFEKNRDRIANYPEDLIDMAKLILENFPKETIEDRPKDHIVKYTEDKDEVVRISAGDF